MKMNDLPPSHPVSKAAEYREREFVQEIKRAGVIYSLTNRMTAYTETQ